MFRRIFSAGLLTVAAAGLLGFSASAVAQEEEKADKYAVPEEGGTPALLKFIEGLQQIRPTSRQEAMKKISAQKAAAEKIVETEKETSPDYAVGQGFLLEARTILLLMAPSEAEERNQVYTDLSEHLTKKAEKINAKDAMTACYLAMAIQQGGDEKQTLEVYKNFVEILKKSKDPQARQIVLARLEGPMKLLTLVGNEMEIKGKLVDGKEIDWASYRGKVVLVDYWATWCGPCVAELPNVKENYAKYHEKGFEVVGISLDEDRERLNAFLEKHEIPWVSLFEDGAGWRHPMASAYGISGIPRAILVDKKGKVVTTNARGPALGEHLKELLGE
ncbi:MAG: TlpA family protein disulfide reductase [Planctomycetales bacterium]